MRILQLQFEITLTDNGTGTLAQIIQQVTESLPRKMTKQELSGADSHLKQCSF